MSTVLQIYEAIDRLAPFSLSMDFDNTGILVGDRQKKVERALLALDCTKEVLRQAKELGAQLIITHHPIIFHPIKRVNEDSLVYHLLRSDIAVISAHTNLDIAQGGVNDLLAKRHRLERLPWLAADGCAGNIFPRQDRQPSRRDGAAAVCAVSETAAGCAQRKICGSGPDGENGGAVRRCGRGLSGGCHPCGRRCAADLGGQAA